MTLYYYILLSIIGIMYNKKTLVPNVLTEALLSSGILPEFPVVVTIETKGN